MQEVMEPILQIQVLGKFTLRYGETVISDEDDRSRKVWAVLAYLIYHREKIISQQELVDLCWGEDTRSSDPHNALKSVIHRIRATLDKLQELIRQNLRKGDVASQCSVSQYVILLPRANYENSHMVANRLMTAFYRRYPHSPARLRCVVQPLEPVE